MAVAAAAVAAATVAVVVAVAESAPAPRGAAAVRLIRTPLLALTALVSLAACATAPYSAYPLDLAGGLPADAFATCLTVLQRRYGPVAIADESAFRLQTEWLGIDDPPGERRATVFRDERGLGVVVELRRPSQPWFGLPSWTEPRGWDEAERELAGWLREALEPPATP